MYTEIVYNIWRNQRNLARERFSSGGSYKQRSRRRYSLYILTVLLYGSYVAWNVGVWNLDWEQGERSWPGSEQGAGGRFPSLKYRKLSDS